MILANTMRMKFGRFDRGSKRGGTKACRSNRSRGSIAGVFKQRTLATYGDPLGPTIEFLRAKGKSREKIIAGATRPGQVTLSLPKSRHHSVNHGASADVVVADLILENRLL